MPGPRGAGRIARAGRRLLGRDLPPETGLLTRRLFLALLAVVYAAAFGSLWVQVHGLVGSRGIAPAGPWLAALEAGDRLPRWWELPSLFRLWPRDAALHALCAGGMGAAGLLLVGAAPRLAAAVLWLFYLSLVSIGSLFLSYQWDGLLLETGFLAIWLAPARLAPAAARRAPVEPLVLWLLRFLLFKLMFLSGAVKLLSGDPSWPALRAMDFHYLTQPLPSPSSWWVHQLPAGFHSAEVVATFAVELAVPWLIFAPRPLRRLAFLPLAGLQLLISATGNYGFFNLLTLALCVLLLDDAVLRRLLPRRLRPEPADPQRAWRRGASAGRVALACLAVLLLSLSLLRMDDRLGMALFRPVPLVALGEFLAPLRSVNDYGLFAVMTTRRDEISLEGSRDGRHWQAYRFRFKPGPPERAPALAGLHMPRLDWQLWFAALRGCERAPWFHAFLRRVLQAEPSVLALLAEDPFAGEPPRLLRTPLYRYDFAPPGADDWWRREPIGRFCPTVRLVGDELRAVSARGSSPGAPPRRG